MTSGKRQLPQTLREGRRALDGISGVELLQPPEPFGESWVLSYRLTVDVPKTSSFPSTTDWFVLVDESYPLGNISFYPSRGHAGLRGVYWHQRHPGHRSNTRWTDAKICLSLAEGFPGRDRFLFEPATAQLRLAWHFQRALTWLAEASAGLLAREGDRFELPDFPSRTSSLVAFSENQSSLQAWEATSKNSGVASTARLGPATTVITAFLSQRRQTLVRPSWGTAITGAPALPDAAWIRLRDVPVLPPWQAPSTWGELRQALRGNGFDVDEAIHKPLSMLRDKEEHLLLLGFPIPATVRGPSARMHWLALDVGRLALQTPGFRKTERHLWRADRLSTFRDSAPIAWLSSANWNETDLGTRGRLSPRLRSARVLLLGAGTLGSLVAELLIRGGVTDMVVLDSDRLLAGNLLRHSLSLADVGREKASCLAGRLNSISPHARVVGFNEDFPPSSQNAEAACKRCNLVVDCTGTNDILAPLSRFGFLESACEFWSLSLGSDGHLAFIYSELAPHFSADRFLELIAASSPPAATSTVSEGIGCWNPVFPARADEVSLLAAAAVSEMNQLTPTARPRLVTFRHAQPAAPSPITLVRFEEATP